ncbi:AAA family ATPase [Roseomonas mucosa]|uniref:Uncharacterized conserved protein n=1 Tax=Roseomonas mucosa TaxID=207340 RepID=A0A379MXG2_9PROT|nr:ATP-binding protein [Roseomonas mucosa]QDE01468.1 ABC transporter ATP-binding protein [Roseomonas mucosa]SUE37961.1 Uncharacterized conserved protein [Roseomonas mucosa]
MVSVNISDFSCIKDANLQLAPVNIIIGPQGSGKSVTTKVLYFCNDIIVNSIQSAEKGESIEDFKKSLAKQFSLWFPPSAWGQERFTINYAAGDFTARILRRRSKGRVSDEISITFSEWFADFYSSALTLFEKSRTNSDDEIKSSAQATRFLDQFWRIRDIVSRRLLTELKNDYFAQQTFIPAGRAFFTSIGRLVAGFEQAGNLDPVTIKFARLFATIRDRNSRRYVSRLHRLGPDFLEKRRVFMENFFGGELNFKDDLEFVETQDGRKIPFSSLSSGQQELLPMWSLIDYFNEMDSYRQEAGVKVPRGPRELIYIEEPEAHLFPSAQSLLMEFLIGSVTPDKSKRCLIITTHSPYIMGKLNVFLKAGQLARRKKKNQEINDVVPRECWLNDKQLSAFAIEDGKLRSLLDEDSLIDGRYLDQISEDISRDFSKLLRIEAEI